MEKKPFDPADLPEMIDPTQPSDLASTLPEAEDEDSME